MTLIQANGKTQKRKREEVEEDDGVVVVTDLRPLSDRLHEKLEQAASARKRKNTDTIDQPVLKKQRPEKKKPKKKDKSKRENGISTTTTTTTTTSSKPNKSKFLKEEDSDDDLLVEDTEVIHVDDYYNELTNKVLNTSYAAPKLPTDDIDYEEDIRMRLLGIKKPEHIMSPVWLLSTYLVIYVSILQEFQEDIQYGTFDFSSGQAIPQYLANTKQRNTTKRLEYLIKKVLYLNRSWYLN